MSLIVKDLSKIYGTQKALDNISFEAKNGQILGFLGPNGAGKSTTMKIATCYVPPTSGTIEVCGFDILKNSNEVKKNIGYLPEHNPLYLDMYVHEYLDFIAQLHGLNSSLRKKRKEEMISLCGLQIEQNKKIGALSKGYRQRVGLAQALIHDPKVLILDEPTTGLDPNQIVEIRNLIKNISADKTVIFSTHIMKEVELLCDQVVIINKGKIVANENVKNLQNFKGKFNKVSIQLNEYLNPALFEAIVGVNAVESLGENKYLLLSDASIDIRHSLSNIILQNNKLIIELKQEEDSLEKVFQELTL